MKLRAKSNDRSQSELGPVSRFIWARLAYHQIFINTPVQNNKTHVIFSINRGQGVPVTIELTALTEIELAAFKHSVLIATEIAEPICRELDLRAQEDLQNGNDANPRCYRPLPSVVIRPRAFREYSGRVLDGREDVLSGMQLNVLSTGELSADGSGLDESGSEQSNGAKVNS